MVWKYGLSAVPVEERNEKATESKKTVYNSRSEYSRLMNLPFGQLKIFWRYLDDSSKSMLLRSAEASTKEGTKEWNRIRDTVNSYEPTGPLGSQDPLLPVNVKDLESKLLGEDDKLRNLWKKANISNV